MRLSDFVTPSSAAPGGFRPESAVPVRREGMRRKTKVPHGVFLLHRRKHRSEPKNYRGVQPAAQTMERLLDKLFLPNLSVAFAPRQIVHAPGRGTKDALLTVVPTRLGFRGFPLLLGRQSGHRCVGKGFAYAATCR